MKVSAPQLDTLLVRELCASDRDAFAGMFERLSPQSRMRRYLAPKPSLTSRELSYLTDVDHVRHSAIAAIDAAGRMTGVARYAAYPGAEPTADVAVEVVDEWRRCGVGLLLTTRVIERAVANGFLLLRATTMWENVPARAPMHRLGFRPWSSSNGLIELELPMSPPRTAGHTG